MSTVSGLLYAFLPETLGSVLPDTVVQAERLGRTSNASTNRSVLSLARWLPTALLLHERRRP